MALADNPTYATIILENRQRPQFVVGNVNFLGIQNNLRTTNLLIKNNINYIDTLDGRPLLITTEPIPIPIPIPDPIPETTFMFKILSQSAAIPSVFFRSNVTTNKLGVTVAFTDRITIPNTLKIETQGPKPKILGANLVQGQTYNVNLSKFSFNYDYDATIPNEIRFDLSSYPKCMVFVKDRNGYENLPAIININALNVLTITGIPPDPNGICFGMIMVI